ALPGTLTGVDRQCLQIAAASREVEIRTLLTLEGVPMPISEVIARFGLQAGDRLQEIEEGPARQLTEQSASLCRHEAFWVQRVAALRPVALPFVGRDAAPTSPPRSASLWMPIPEE